MKIKKKVAAAIKKSPTLSDAAIAQLVLHDDGGQQRGSSMVWKQTLKEIKRQR